MNQVEIDDALAATSGGDLDPPLGMDDEKMISYNLGRAAGCQEVLSDLDFLVEKFKTEKKSHMTHGYHPTSESKALASAVDRLKALIHKHRKVKWMDKRKEMLRQFVEARQEGYADEKARALDVMERINVNLDYLGGREGKEMRAKIRAAIKVYREGEEKICKNCKHEKCEGVGEDVTDCPVFVVKEISGEGK